MMKRIAAIALLISAIATPPATVGAEGAPPVCDAPVETRGLKPRGPILRICRAGTGAPRLATRRFLSGGDELLLTVDPDSLLTRVERAQCLACEETTDEAQAGARFLKAVQKGGAPPAGGFSTNAGLAHGAGGGTFVTGDLCPSRRPLDRGFFEKLATASPGAPVALAVSGLWLTRHKADFDWLKQQARAGALDILWANHSYRHPYVPDREDRRNYLMTMGSDVEREALDTERLLLENDVVPSVFFRFPGLVADIGLLEGVRRLHLVALGADGWLALGPPLREGSIVLVHPNGNEPAGLRLFSKLLEKGALRRPFRPLNEAP